VQGRDVHIGHQIGQDRFQHVLMIVGMLPGK